MLNIKYGLPIVLSCLLLTACQDKSDAVSYLLQQPQGRSYVELLQRDPEKFGQEILEAEMSLAALKQEWEKSQRNYPASNIEARAKAAYENKRQEIELRLKVASLSSPE
jgi:hypothetical protein